MSSCPSLSVHTNQIFVQSHPVILPFSANTISLLVSILWPSLYVHSHWLSLSVNIHSLSPKHRRHRHSPWPPVISCSLQTRGGGTALHQGLSKYLTAQDTRGTPTLTKHNRTLSRLGNLLPLQPRSTTNVNWVFFLSLVLIKLIKKLDIALSW